MRVGWVALATLLSVSATPVSAQVLDLTGQFRCVQGCIAGLAGQRAFVNQIGTDLHLVNEAGEPSRAWIDWPGHIWSEAWHEGGLYSPDGMTIQFDRGTVWLRDLGEAVPAVPVPQGAARARNRVAVVVGVPPTTVNSFDGSWSVVVLTQRGGCQPSYRYSVRIRNGNIFSEGGDAGMLQGRVSPTGAVQVSVASDSGQADGEGQLSGMLGTGTWRGAGSGTSCVGVWQATRRG